MGLETLFFDSYAFFEIAKGNPDYESLVKNVAIMTTRLNLMEFYYGILVSEGADKADEYYGNLVKFAIEIDDEAIKEAMKFRAFNKKKGLSYVDCIGYIIALKNNAKFLTGDEQFRDLKNVEFIK